MLEHETIVNEVAVREEIRNAIAYYKHIPDWDDRFKWEAVKWYRDHWKIDAVDFADMLEVAFSKADILLAGGMYYPYKMIVSFAKRYPELVREAFKTLYDETLPLGMRCEKFQACCKKLNDQIQTEKGKKQQPYQDLRAIMVYLTFEFPEKYFFFKSRMFTSFSKLVGYHDSNNGRKSSVWKVESYNCLCEIVLDEVKQDPELIKLSKQRLNDDCYEDDALHILTMDVIHYYTGYTNSKTYWPSLEEYDPGMTEEMWLEALRDPSVTTEENLDMLMKMMEQGGESTCAHLEEVYRKSYAYYNALGTSFGAKVKKKYNCPDCPKHASDQTDHNRVYVVPFVGRDVVENGKTRFSWKLREELQDALEQIAQGRGENIMTDIGLNTILYGPPGTGKTYHAVIYAVAIIENKKLADVAAENYSEVLNRYQKYREQKQVEFTTFHQSYGYEEFIEGIKPRADEDGGDVRYSVQPGVFKAFCEQAQRYVGLDRNYGFNENPTVWKVSLDGTGDNPIRKECMEHDHIRIGWDAYGEEITDETVYSDGGKIVLGAFINRMQIGDIVLSCFSSSTIDAIGVVTGEYEWHDEYAKLKRLRKVRWIVKGIRENILSLNGETTMTLSSVYRLNIPLSGVYELIEKYIPDEIPALTERQKNYVFIIDEINRGNISKIFGELITLLEESKRAGKTEAVKVRLPYSMEMFSVPQNVYIIGTMNTADRSIAALDTALRRRFQFREMMPDPALLHDVEVDGVSMETLLARMNRRIAILYDREHTIGHAYFMPLKDSPTIETLAGIFKNSIIPLLQEYFYEDYEKIRLVLSDNQKADQKLQFIIREENNDAALFGITDGNLYDQYSFRINPEAFDKIEAYKTI